MRERNVPTYSQQSYRNSKLVGGGWGVPVASLSHSPSLFIHLAVVIREKKKQTKKRFSTSDLSELRPLPAMDSSGTSRPGKSHKLLLSSYATDILRSQVRWECTPLLHDAAHAP